MKFTCSLESPCSGTIPTALHDLYNVGFQPTAIWHRAVQQLKAQTPVANYDATATLEARLQCRPWHASIHSTVQGQPHSLVWPQRIYSH